MARRHSARAVAVIAAAVGLAPVQPASTARADAPPPWFARVRDVAVAQARAPLSGEALSAASTEVRRAAAVGLPQLHLGERSRLGLDARFTLEIEAGVRLPVIAPTADADRRLSEARLDATRRQLRAQRRAVLHDTLADAVALLATEARVRALDALAAALQRADGTSTAPWTPGVPIPETAPARSRRPAGAPAVRRLDVRLLAAQRSAQRRRAAAIARSLSLTLGVPVPAPRTPAEPAAATATSTRAPPASASRLGMAPPAAAPPAEAAAATRDPLGWPAAALEPDRCVLASDAVTAARLALTDARLSRALDDARARTRIDLELSGTATLGDEADVPGYALRLGVTVVLPPWSPATGAASIALGAAGLEQSLTASWPNAAPAPPPMPPDDASVADASRLVRRELRLLIGREADLLLRRRLLLDALDAPPDGTLAGAYERATRALQLADADEALGVTRLDAALLCGALPP